MEALEIYFIFEANEGADSFLKKHFIDHLV